jgi:hypothetical protein
MVFVSTIWFIFLEVKVLPPPKPSNYVGCACPECNTETFSLRDRSPKYRRVPWQYAECRHICTFFNMAALLFAEKRAGNKMAHRTPKSPVPFKPLGLHPNVLFRLEGQTV